MTFRIVALPPEPFAPLFALDDEALVARRARRIAATSGCPCRVSLIDAEPGETLLLIHHEHQPADTPFRAGHAIFVRERALRAEPRPGVVPPALLARTLSLRAFNADDMMVTADLVDGRDSAARLDALLADPAVAYVHIHYAAHGCYAALARRA